MTPLPGIYVLAEPNFSDHGATRLGASALMQGLGDGYFVLPYTIGHYFASVKPAKVSTSRPEFKAAEESVGAFTNKLLAIKGKRSTTSLHPELGILLWEKCLIAPHEASL